MALSVLIALVSRSLVEHWGFRHFRIARSNSATIGKDVPENCRGVR